MNKEEFLVKLKERLEGYKEEDVKEVIEFYDELISEAVEAGKNEKETIENLGTIDSIIKKVEIDKKVQKVKEKPNLSNGLIAIISILGVITSPIWVTIIFVIGILIFVLFILLFSLVLTFGITAIALVLAIVGIIVGGYGAFTSITGIFGIIGLLFITTGITMVLGKLIFKTLPIATVSLFKKIVYKVKGE